MSKLTKTFSLSLFKSLNIEFQDCAICFNILDTESFLFKVKFRLWLFITFH